VAAGSCITPEPSTPNQKAAGGSACRLGLISDACLPCSRQPRRIAEAGDNGVGVSADGHPFRGASAPKPLGRLLGGEGLDCRSPKSVGPVLLDGPTGHATATPHHPLGCFEAEFDPKRSCLATLTSWR